MVSAPRTDYRYHALRTRALELINEAVESGARLGRACDILGLTARTVQRWREQSEQGFDLNARQS